MPRKDSRISRSSSTTSTLCILCFGLSHLSGQWKLDNKLRAGRFIFLYAYGTVMIFNDPSHNGETKSGAALFGGEIRQKKLFFHFAIDAMTGIRDENLQRLAASNQ